jgi:hypothetical protein
LLIRVNQQSIVVNRQRFTDQKSSIINELQGQPLDERFERLAVERKRGRLRLPRELVAA